MDSGVRYGRSTRCNDVSVSVMKRVGLYDAFVGASESAADGDEVNA